MVPFLTKICSYLSDFGKVLKTIPLSEYVPFITEENGKLLPGNAKSLM